MQLFSVETFLSGPESLFSPFMVKVVITAFVVSWGIQLWFNIDARLYLAKRLRARRNKAGLAPSPSVGAPWSELETRAQAVIDTVWTKLPSEISAEAVAIPLFFSQEPKRGASGRRTLGIYQGFTQGMVSENKGPIVLYLRNIEQMCLEDGDDFAQQVRLTYLHEVGHHFGWSEQEVKERGL